MPATGEVNRALRRGASKAFLLRTTGFGLLFLLHMVLGRSLGTGGYGTYSFTMAVVGLAAVIAPLGWPVILQRYVAQYVAVEAWGKLVGVLTRSFQVTLLAGLITSALMGLTALVAPLAVDRASALGFAALLIPIMALVKLRRNALQGLGDMAGMLVPEEIMLPALLMVSVIALQVHQASHALWLYFLWAIVSFGIGTIWLRRSLPDAVSGIQPEFMTRAWMAAALPMLGSDLSKYAMNRTDILLLGAMADLDTVGLYAAANRLAQLTPFVMIAVNAAAAPLLAAAHADNDPDRFRSVLRRAILWSTTGALPVFVVLVAFPAPLLELFGTGFTDGRTLLRILAGGQLINAASGPVGFALIMSKRERIFAGLVAGTAIFNLVGNVVAIPIWGGTGAAAVTAVAVALLNGGAFMALRSLGREERQ